MKVYELSKELNIDNKELIKIAKSLEIEVTSHMSMLSEEQIQIIKDSIVNNSNLVTPNDDIKLTQKEKSVWKPDLTRMICIKNIGRGKLVYKSKRVLGYTIIWEKTGDKNYMELGEFINLKNSDRRFITEPWIRIVEDDEIEILKYANIFDFYKEILGLNNISDIFQLKFEVFKKKFDKLPDGYKNSVAEQAAQMIKAGELDSIKIKEYIEKVMEIDLDVLTKPESKNKLDSIDIK